MDGGFGDIDDDDSNQPLASYKRRATQAWENAIELFERYYDYKICKYQIVHIFLAATLAFSSSSVLRWLTYSAMFLAVR